MFGRKPYDHRLLLQDKLNLIDLAFEAYDAKTFADLGGVWRVEGGYSFYAASKHGATGHLVDTHPTERVRKIAARWPQVALVEGSFGDPAVAQVVSGADVLFLFDVLLHQVRPDWDEILRMYAGARIILIYNQQWTGPETVRLTDLGESDYFLNTPHRRDEPPYDSLFDKLDEPHPDHGGRTWREVHHVWQWGITDRSLLSALWDLGYRLEHFKDCGRFGTLPRFENHAMLVRK